MHPSSLQAGEERVGVGARFDLAAAEGEEAALVAVGDGVTEGS